MIVVQLQTHYSRNTNYHHHLLKNFKYEKYFFIITSNNHDITKNEEIIDTLGMNEFFNAFVGFLTDEMNDLITHNQEIFFRSPLDSVGVFFIIKTMKSI